MTPSGAEPEDATMNDGITKLSEASFAEDWQSPEDAAYDGAEPERTTAAASYCPCGIPDCFVNQRGQLMADQARAEEQARDSAANVLSLSLSLGKQIERVTELEGQAARYRAALGYYAAPQQWLEMPPKPWTVAHDALKGAADAT